jgi:hypothetical protein
MNVVKPVRLADEVPMPGTEVEGEIRGLVRREVASYRRQPEPSGETMVAEAHAVVQRISLSSVHEIDNIIGELQGLREFLQSESERLQREITEYVELAETAVNSTKIIAQNMMTRKSVAADL